MIWRYSIWAIPWWIAVCFFQDKSRPSNIRDSQGFEATEKAREAVKVFLSGFLVSLFLCEAGCITTFSSGQVVLEGLELIFLENAEHRMRALLYKKYYVKTLQIDLYKTQKNGRERIQIK